MSEFSNDLIVRIKISTQPIEFGNETYVDLDFRNNGGTIPFGIYFRLSIVKLDNLDYSQNLTKVVIDSNHKQEIINLFSHTIHHKSSYEYHTHYMPIMSDIETEMMNHSPEGIAFWNSLPLDYREQVKSNVLSIRNMIYPPV